jgi:SNF2 family DNA or RNA helicase
MLELRPYQTEDAEFLSKLSCSACFNEQRTGKTPIALRTLAKRGCTKILIVCPASAVLQWRDEFERWLEKPCVAIYGTPTKREKAIKDWTDGAVISYDSLKTTSNHFGSIDDILNQNPEGVILDEAHRIKNHKSAATQSIDRLNKIPNRIALTGTPAPNQPYEVYSILHWLYPNQFSAYWPFIREYFTTCRRSNMSGISYIEIGGFKNPFEEGKLLDTLNTISTQRKRKDVMQWLPDKDYQRIHLDPTKEQKKYLRDLKDTFETEHVITQGILDRLIRYRQICNAPKLLDLPGTSPKIEWILSYAKDYPDQPTIIFSKFTKFLKLIEDELFAHKIKFGIIYGETPIKKRQEIIQTFQAGKLNILLINIDAGKEALTLDRAVCTIFTDKYPPAGTIAQAEDRFVATTEKNKDKGHLIIELCMKGTYDEELYRLVARRASMVDVINNYTSYLKGGEKE